jgi:uncharacterized membrane protein
MKSPNLLPHTSVEDSRCVMAYDNHPGDPDTPVPQTQANPQRRLMVEEHYQELFAGPVPHPDILRQYESVLPGAAERIFALTEQQATHRMMLEQITVKRDTARASLGVVCAIVIALAALLLAGYAVSKGYAWQGLGFGTIDLATLVGVFVYGTNSRRNERDERRRTVQGERPS